MSMLEPISGLMGPLSPAAPLPPEAGSAQLLMKFAEAADAVDRAQSASNGGLAAEMRPAPLPGGTPTSAPAVRSDFHRTDARADAGRLQGYPAAEQHKWRLSEVVAALGTAATAERLLEKARTPGPAEPGTLLHALKTMPGAPLPKRGEAGEAE